MNSINVIRRKLSELEPDSVQQKRIESRIQYYVDADPQLPDEETIAAIREDFPQKCCTAKKLYLNTIEYTTQLKSGSIAPVTGSTQGLASESHSVPQQNNSSNSKAAHSLSMRFKDSSKFTGN
eukprot:IDg7107t1